MQWQSLLSLKSFLSWSGSLFKLSRPVMMGVDWEAIAQVLINGIIIMLDIKNGSPIIEKINLNEE